MDKDELPRYSDVVEQNRHRRHRRRSVKIIVILVLTFIVYLQWTRENRTRKILTKNPLLSIDRLHADHATCAKLRSVPEDPSGPRERSGRYVEGQKAVLIKNATIWTGEPAAGISPQDAHAGKGYSWIQSDVLLEYGLIKQIAPSITNIPSNCTTYDARGRPLTAGIVDMHSHAGVESLPSLKGSSDGNELSNDITPYVRSIDGFNPLDPQLQVIKSGGVTTSLILPGSGNNMGGEAYVIKHASYGRPEISAEDMLADPDKNWRYMKMACGENSKSVYGRVGRDFGPFSRLGEAWFFRHAFEQASNLVKAQDDWCEAADRQGAANMPSYLPMELQWESLCAVLRGQVLVNTHCYTVPDLEAFVHHTNEFKFPVRAFHHAHQTYLVPEILKRAYGGRPPAAALFADNMYYKVEAYTASEQAGKILYENGITPVYVSDNPVINAQHVVFEAAKAYKNGLPYHAALAGVTSAPAELLGLGGRIGKVKAGYDADIVVWDSDPLAVGATPRQVWIDGMPQCEDPTELKKIDFKPLHPKQELQDLTQAYTHTDSVVLAGVTSVLLPGLEQNLNLNGGGYAVVENGSITCLGACEREVDALAHQMETITLKDGHIVPPATAFGSFLGLQEILLEEDTQDGPNDENSFSAAVDGLSFTPKNLYAAYSHGVTKAITAPAFKNGGHKGLSVGFRTGALVTGEKHAWFKNDISLHYTLTLSAKQGKTPSLSSAVGGLRSKLIKALQTENITELSPVEDYCLDKVVKGEMPLVITVHSADAIASILEVKAGIEAAMDLKREMKLIIFGGAESWILADELAENGVGVVLAPLLAYGETWDQRRSLSGAPLTNGTAVDRLHAAGVKVAISTAGVGDWETRDLHLLAGIVHANSNGRISDKDSLAMVSSNIYEMLGLVDLAGNERDEFVVYEGNPLKSDSRVRAVSDGTGVVGLWT